MDAPATPPPRAAAVVVAAGRSTRMGADAPRKPLVLLAGRPLLEHAVAALDAAALVVEVVVVAHADDVDRIERWCAERAAFAKVRAVVPGGAERADSVRLGARWCGFHVDVIAVHDAARPLVAPAHVDAVVARAHAEGAALLAVPIRDTLKAAADGDPRVERTVDRTGLWAAQTPQAFRARPFRELLARAEAEGFRPTDDAALWERWRGPVAVVEGDPSNFKVTGPADLALAEAVLAARGAGGDA